MPPFFNKTEAFLLYTMLIEKFYGALYFHGLRAMRGRAWSGPAYSKIRSFSQPMSSNLAKVRYET